MADENFFIAGAEEILPPVNDSPYKRILAVGDIHGKFKALISLWEKLNVTDDDFVIFLGDYIDRGEDVAKVLEWVVKHKDKKNFIFLRGNHEQLMIDAIKSNGMDSFTWLINGGKTTISALRELNSNKIIPFNDVRSFVENLPLSYTIDVGGRKYFFCHAGVDSKIPLDKQSQHFLLWAREEFFNNYDGNAVIISGHSPIKYFYDFDANNPRPIKIPEKNIIMVDTGAFITDGRLSAVDILSGRYWQSGQDKLCDVIFVCEWNTCRSAMAKYIMRHLLKNDGLANEIFVDSAGCITDGGEYIGTRTLATLEENDIPVSLHVSKPFTAREYKNFKRIIALDRKTLQILKNKFGDPDNKIRLFKNFHGKEMSIADPGAKGEHAKAYSQIYSGCNNLLKEIRYRLNSTK